jgi:hypothetical protein
MWHKEDFEKTVDMPFENIVIPVPIGYDRILTQLYGNYMEFPPLDKRQGKHVIWSMCQMFLIKNIVQRIMVFHMSESRKNR